MKTGELQRDPPVLLGASATAVPTRDRQDLHGLEESFAALDRHIVHGVARRFIPGEGSLLDTSSGCAPCDRLALDLSQRFAADRPVEVDVYALPAGDASHAALFGLGTFDRLDDPERARDEIARVLAPGGAFLHFLDRNDAWIGRLFKTLARHGKIPFPNFLADPSLLDQLDERQRDRLPVTACTDDLLVASWQEFGAVLQVLFELGHSISNRLIPYARRFNPATFNAAETAAEFARLCADPRRLSQLNKMLLTVYLAVNDESNRELAPLELKPLAALDFFTARLRGWFDGEHGFAIELCELVSARLEHADHFAGPERYQLRSVGRRLALADVPAQPAGLDLSAPHQPSADSAAGVVESALHVFVARKLTA